MFFIGLGRYGGAGRGSGGRFEGGEQVRQGQAEEGFGGEGPGDQVREPGWRRGVGGGRFPSPEGALDGLAEQAQEPGQEGVELRLEQLFGRGERFETDGEAEGGEVVVIDGVGGIVFAGERDDDGQAVDEGEVTEQGGAAAGEAVQVGEEEHAVLFGEPGELGGGVGELVVRVGGGAGQAAEESGGGGGGGGIAVEDENGVGPGGMEGGEKPEEEAVEVGAGGGTEKLAEQEEDGPGFVGELGKGEGGGFGEAGVVAVGDGLEVDGIGGYGEGVAVGVSEIEDDGGGVEEGGAGGGTVGAEAVEDGVGAGGGGGEGAGVGGVDGGAEVAEAGLEAVAAAEVAVEPEAEARGQQREDGEDGRRGELVVVEVGRGLGPKAALVIEEDVELAADGVEAVELGGWRGEPVGGGGAVIEVVLEIFAGLERVGGHSGKWLVVGWSDRRAEAVREQRLTAGRLMDRRKRRCRTAGTSRNATFSGELSAIRSRRAPRGGRARALTARRRAAAQRPPVIDRREHSPMFAGRAGGLPRRGLWHGVGKEGRGRVGVLVVGSVRWRRGGGGDRGWRRPGSGAPRDERGCKRGSGDRGLRCLTPN